MKQFVATLLAFAITACGSEGPGADEAAPRPSELPTEQASSEAANAHVASEEGRACHKDSFEDVLLTHCIANPRRHVIRTVLRPRGGGDPYRGLGKYAVSRGENPPAEELVFAMNAGMFDDAGLPIGYYAESGKVLKTLNTNEGIGNFHLLPNGVFFGKDGDWHVVSADAFENFVEEQEDREKDSASDGYAPEFATQSGPMLVIDGELHPKLSRDGISRYIRNGVGTDAEGRAHFVISEAPLSFGKLARFFRDELETDNALYLDGNVSALWEPLGARMDASPPLGPLIVVENRAKPVAEKKAAPE